MPFPILRRIIPPAVALALTACADLTGLDFVGGHLTSISVDHGAIVEVGDTVRLSATGSVDGLIGLFSYDRLLDASWAISDPTIAQLQLLPPPLSAVGRAGHGVPAVEGSRALIRRDRLHGLALSGRNLTQHLFKSGR